MIEPLNIGVSNKKEFLNFSNDKDAMNHVVLEDKKEDNKTNVKSYSLDEILGGRIPQFIKIDVEGFENNIIEGAKHTLSNQNLFGIIIELIGGGKWF